MPGKIVIAGGSGLIGSALIDSFSADGYQVEKLVRSEPRPDRPGVSETKWRPGEVLSPKVLTGAAAVICLNGSSVGRLPWTSSYRETLYKSRLAPTRTIAHALSKLGDKAPLYVSASAVGYYGHQPGAKLTEDSPAGNTFLAKLCVEWEALANSAGTDRVALLRTAPVLHPEGMLKPMMLLTKLGLAGPLGSGNQHWPWISLIDEVRAIRHVINQHLTGPINLTGPEPATANAIGRELAKQLGRPFWFPTPEWLLNTVLGKRAAGSLLTSDAAVWPTALQESGFEFQHSTVAAAIASGI